MKNVFKSLGIFLAFFFLGINSLYAQCILFPGNLVFSGVNLDDDGVDGTSGNDRFSFVLLQDVSENFEIHFTDLGWTTSNSFQSTTKALTDGIIKWTAPMGGVEAGTQITIDAKYALAATLGTVSGVRATPNNPDLYLDLGISGDQLFAFTGTVNSPTFIAGINLNQSWTSLLADRLTSSESFLPVALNAANVQNVSLVSSIDNGFSNAVISSNSFSGLFSNIVAVFNQNTNWVFEDSYQPDAVPSGFQLPKALNFVITPFNFLNNPTGVNTITYGGNTQFTVTKIDSRTIGSYQWQVSSNEGTDYVALTNAGIYSGTATSTLVITKPPVSHNSYRYRVVAMDACGNEAISNHIQLSVNRKSLTVNLIGTIEKERDGTTQASIANENLELTGLIGIDDVSVLNPGSGTYASALPGTGIQVTVTGLSITGSDAGNYTLSSTSAAANVGIIVDKTPPAGYSVSIDQNLINESNASAVSFTIAGAEIGATLNYSFTSSGGGTPVTGSGTITSANQQFTGIDIRGLAKGTITLSLTLTDPYTNEGQAATDTSIKEAPIPTITSATYNAGTGVLVVTGTDFLSNSTGADVDASKLTLVGEGGEIYTLTDTFGSEITSLTSFTLALSSTDRLNLGTIFNKNGMASTGGTTYNLAAADNWLTAAEVSNDMSDLTGNGITVSNVAVPSITSATYNWSTGSLVVSGTWFVMSAGASNDIVATRFALTGEGGTTYTLTDTQNSEITNGTSFTLNLSATDQAAIKPILNKNGLSAIDATTYNLAAAEDWSAGTNPAVVIADLSGNSILVSNVNQTPTATPPTSPTVEEDNAPVLISGMSVSDGEGDNQILSFTITGGVLSLGTDGITFGGSGNGSANFTASGTLTEINTALAAATFAPTPDLFGTNAGGISFTANDGTSTSAVASATFDILGINDDPTFIGLPASITVVEDVSPSYLSNALSAGTFNDVDAGSNDVTLILTVSSGTLGFANPQGIISIIGNGTSVANLVGTVTNIESYLSINTNVSYNPALNLNGVAAATLTVSANDGGNTGSGGGTNVSLGQIQIDITPVNDAPTVANPIPNQNATEDAVFNFQFANNTFADVDAGSALTYSAQFSGGGALPSWLSFDPLTRTFSGIPLNANVGTVSIDVIANDGDGGTVTDTFDIIVANTNDAPTVANPIPNQNATENIAFNFQFAANTFNDIDIGDVLTYTAQLAGGGALPAWLSFGELTRTFSGTPGNDNSGVIAIEIIANDGEFSVSTFFELSIQGVNDAPVITAPNTISVFEDEPKALTGISFTDIDAGTSNVLVTFEVGSGTLAASSSAEVSVGGSSSSLTLTGSVDEINSFLSNEELTFTTSLNSTQDVILAIEIDDQGNTGSGGSKTDAADLTLIVTAVNDAPVNAVPGDQQVDQNATLTFSLGNANQVSISDVDAGGGTVEVSLSATNGVLTLAGVTGLTFTTGDGTADGSMTFRGSIANINTAISTLTFYPTSNYNGLAIITITTSDLGLNGSGGAQTDSDMILITVNAINPVVTSVSSITTNGLYKIGEVISIQVRFDQNLTVDTDLGIPTLSLETGVSDALAAYTSGSGTNILTFQYTVKEGNSTADLDYTGTAALLLNGAKITNAEALDALLTLPAPGALNSLSANSTLSIDGIRPTVNIVINDTALSVGETTTVTITFNEAVSGLDAGDFTVANGTLSGLSSADGGSTWSAIFTPNANVQDATNLITLDNTGVVDMAGNTGVGSTDSNNYAIDTSRPTASVVVADTQLISGETTQVTITFSEAVIGLTTADLTVSNGFLSALSSADGGITWTTTLTPSSGVEDATNVIELANVGVADLAGNTGTGTTTSNNYAIDTRRPTVTIVVSDTQLSLGETSLVTITFTEAVNGLALDDFTIQNGSLSGLSTSDGGITWTATLTPDSGVEDATNLITLDNTGYQDLAGNTGSGISNSNNYSVDTINPTGYSVSIVPDRINGVNQNDFSFNLVDGEIGTTYSYSISSSGGGTPVTGNGTVSNINQFIDGINVSTLPDGELTLIVTLTDPSGNVGAEESDTVEKLLPAILTISAITQADEAGTDGEFEVLTSNLFAANTSVTIVVSGTATNGTDYTTIGSSFVFPANTSSVIIPVSVIDDIDVEGNETVIIRLVETNNPLVSVGSPAEATVTITDNDVPSPLTITPTVNQNKVYGSAEPSFTFTASGFNLGDDISGIQGLLSRAPGEDAGAYAFALGNLDAGPNYTLILSPEDFFVNPATITIQVDKTLQKVYGASDPTFTYSASGFVAGEDASILTGALARVSGESVGNYAINQGNLDAGTNYTIAYTGADFAITLKTLVVTADANQNKVYGAAEPTFSYAVTGFENGDDASILTGALGRTSGENVGNYAINQGNLDAGTNYTIDFVASDFDIRSRTLSIMADPGQGKIFGTLDPIFTYTATNFGNGDDASILTGTLGRISGENVGNYAINQGSLSASANYTIAYTGADFAITLKTLVITANANQSKVYGASDPIFTYSATGFENGDDASILTGTLGRISGENVGNYAINQGNLDAGANYTIAYTGADFVITLKTLVVTADANQIKVYGATEPIFSYSANGFENGDDASILTGALARASGENVGNYAINQGTLDAGANYTISYTGADFAITLKTLVVIADANQTKVYGAADSIFSYAVTGFENGDDASILTGALTRISGESVGNYAINQGNLDAGANYTIAYTGADFAITLKTLVVTADANQTKVYGAADPIFSYAVSGFENGDDASILTGTLGRISGEKVGNYAINQGSLSASANYTIAYTGADFAITLKTLVVTADANQTKVYGAADPIFSYSANGFENGDDASILTGALTRVSGENVGSYAINQGNLDAGENYSINYTGADFVITLKTLVVTADANQTKAYGASDPIFTYTANGFENGDDASILTGALTRASGENVGNYAINQGNLDAGDNYTLMYTGADFSITEKTLTITASPSQQKVYGQADPIFTYTASGFENGDDASILTGALARISGENVGNYAINQGNLDAGANYTIAYTGADFAITLKTVVVTADQGQTKVYGKTDPIFTYSLSGFENGEFVLAGALDRVPGENVGTYSIGLGTLDVGSNYTIDYIGSVFTIVKKALQVTAGTDQQKVYGESDPIFTYTVNGFENGDSASILTGALDRAAGQDVGSYAIGKGTLSAGANYTVDFATAGFVITRRVLTITAGNKSKVYGDPNPVLTFTYSGLVSGETKVATEPGIGTNATSGSNVGTYPITLTGGADQNYTITLVNGTLTIGQKDLVITAEDKSKVYGETNPALTFTYSGLVNGDTKVNAEPSIGTTATQSSNVGAYQISLIGGADPNYAITLVNGTLTIGQKALTVTADDKSKVYGETNPTLTFTYTGLVNGDTKAAVEPSISTTALQSSAVGIYPIALTQGEDQNYAITLVNGILTIGQKALTVTADDKQKTYGEANPILTFTYTGLVNGDTKAAVEPSISTTALQSSAVGNYPIALTQGEDQNYAITLVNGTLTIGQKTLTIRADDKQKTYGEVNPILTFTYTGLVNGDRKAAVEPNISTTALQSSRVGTYAIALTGGSDQNYSIIMEAGSMTIGKKELTITAEDKSKMYGETNPALTIRYEGLANGDTKVETEPSISTLALLGSNVGTYPITLTGGADQNYAITMVDGTLTINQALLQIISDSKSKIFGNPDPALTFAASGFQLSDLEAMLTGVLIRLSGETVGVYAISQGSLSAGANYQIEFQGSDFEIIPAELAEFLTGDAVTTPWSVDPVLPQQVNVLTQDGQILSYGVTWDKSTLNLLKRGTYTVFGTVNLPADVLNPSAQKAALQVIVLPKQAPRDIALSNNLFIPNPKVFFQEIGYFTVIDEIDQIHTVELVPGAADNVYFEIKSDFLFWSSSEEAAGMTQFQILVRVTDRDGNVIEKSFTILRDRKNISEITIFNAFSPDGDGINDTWGIPDLKYFAGGTVQVFDRSGQRIFYTESPAVRWDGIFEGKEMPVGSYYWILESKETDELRRGVLTLLRK